MVGKSGYISLRLIINNVAVHCSQFNVLSTRLVSSRNIVSATPKDIYMYMCNYCYTFQRPSPGQPCHQEEEGTPPLLLPVIVHPRRGKGGNSWMRCAEYFNPWWHNTEYGSQTAQKWGLLGVVTPNILPLCN